MADKAYITPNILRWARESARISEDVAAAKVPISVECLIDWEKGNSFPTINQAKKLAKIYRRPFSLFFLPEIPNDFQPLQDFRKKDSKVLGTASIFIIREIQQKQSWISDVNQDNNESPISFVGKFSGSEDPEIVSNDILATLDIDPLNYRTNNPIREWIDKIECKGVFVSRTSFIHSRMKLDSEEIQGFAIADKYAPFIFINSDDWSAPQLFTLIHELVHIWIGQTGISNDIEPKLNKSIVHNKVEMYCNEVAANVLMPKSFMQKVGTEAFTNGISVFKTSYILGVSSFAFLVRASKLNLISSVQYDTLLAEAEVGFQEFLKKEAEKKERQKKNPNSGGPNPYLLRLNKNSRLFTQTVLDYFRGGYIEPNIASALLNTPTNKFQKLEAQIYG